MHFCDIFANIGDCTCASLVVLLHFERILHFRAQNETNVHLEGDLTSSSVRVVTLMFPENFEDLDGCSHVRIYHRISDISSGLLRRTISYYSY